MRQLVRRRAAALTILPILLLAGVAQASLLYRCTMMDGPAREACCCGEELRESDSDPPSMPLISSTSCCDTESRSYTGLDPATSSERSHGALLGAAPIVEPVLVIAAPSPARLVPACALAPPHPRPPIVLQKMSLLL